MHPLIEKLPLHLKQFIVPQQYHLYTAQNQAVWRYVMRMNVHYLQKVAHASYLEGLAQTGISPEHIPSMDEMNEKLAKIGWAAVAVNGFIPPNAFMEFQAYQVLVIAADIRTVEHIEYTPAPDIIHEAAGHAPIIANPEYAEYLRRFGEIGSKAISSAFDFRMFEAIRHLSILKENPNADSTEIEQAEQTVIQLQNEETELSEMAQIRNLHWWTVEYGLFGTTENPKIYGAGLLSSIGESKSCMKPEVKKIVYSIEAAQQSFDITKPQPQLYVTPDFAYLSLVLEEFANSMALRKGGSKGVEKLIQSQQIGTIELSTGLQISGVFCRLVKDDDNKPLYIQTNGATALAHHEKELISHGTSYHKEGFGSPVGKLKGINLAIEDMSPSDLEAYGIYEGKTTTLHFEGGVTVQGEIITGVRNLQGKIVLISFKNCTVSYRNDILFRPEWGTYDMAVGKKIVSAFAGPADNRSFYQNFVPSETTKPIQYAEKDLELFQYYEKVRHFRENNTLNIIEMEHMFTKISNDFPTEWLLFLELYEILPQSELKNRVLLQLNGLKSKTTFGKLIDNGLKLLE